MKTLIPMFLTGALLMPAFTGAHDFSYPPNYFTAPIPVQSNVYAYTAPDLTPMPIDSRPLVNPVMFEPMPAIQPLAPLNPPQATFDLMPRYMSEPRTVTVIQRESRDAVDEIHERMQEERTFQERLKAEYEMKTKLMREQVDYEAYIRSMTRPTTMADLCKRELRLGLGYGRPSEVVCGRR